MTGALKAFFAFALLAGGPSGTLVCFAQDAPSSPDRTSSSDGQSGTDGESASAATLPAKNETAVEAEAVALPIPVPEAGDPFYAPIAAPGAPQTFHERLMDYAVISYGPRSVFTPVLGAAIFMLHPPSAYPPDWQHGMGAFGRQYGSSIATRTSEQTARFLTAAILHEDFRYRPSTSTNPWARSFHAVAFAFIDRSDGDGNRIAFANFASAAAGGFTPNWYLPPGYNTLSRGETRMAVKFGGFALKNLAREFAPEIYRITHRHHMPFPRIPIPAWWNRRE